jgi:hypothetical protein
LCFDYHNACSQRRMIVSLWTRVACSHCGTLHSVAAFPVSNLTKPEYRLGLIVRCFSSPVKDHPDNSGKIDVPCLRCNSPKISLPKLLKTR